MKAKYMKPIVAVERYELSQQIASCNIKMGFGNSACVLNDEDSTPQMKNLAAMGSFVSGLCMMPVRVGQKFDGICYHTNVRSAFNS